MVTGADGYYHAGRFEDIAVFASLVSPVSSGWVRHDAVARRCDCIRLSQAHADADDVGSVRLQKYGRFLAGEHDVFLRLCDCGNDRY